MKGNHSCHAYSETGRENYLRIDKNYTPTGPTQVWVHRFYPDKTLTLPVGVSAGKNWSRKL